MVYVTGNSPYFIKGYGQVLEINIQKGRAHRAQNYRNVQIQFVAVLGNSYVVSLLLTDKRISNSSKLHMQV